MSVQAEYFEVHIALDDQLNMFLMHKKRSDIVKQYLVDLKQRCKASIGAIHHKNDDGTFIEIISVDNSSIFGIIGKSQRIEESIMRRIKDKTGENIESTDFDIEDYRFFLFHTKSLRCAVIKNGTAPKFQRLFSNFLQKYKIPGISSVNAIPIKDENIKRKFSLFKEIGKINMIFTPTSTVQNQILSLENIFNISENNLISSNLSLTLKEQPVSNTLEVLVNNDDLIQNEFNKLEFVGINDQGKEDTLEFVKKLLTLNIEIDIEKDILKYSEAYFDQIKNALRESIYRF